MLPLYYRMLLPDGLQIACSEDRDKQAHSIKKSLLASAVVNGVHSLEYQKPCGQIGDSFQWDVRSDFPKALPPWRKCFVEFPIGGGAKNKLLNIDENSNYYLQQAGALGHTITGEEFRAETKGGPIDELFTRKGIYEETRYFTVCNVCLAYSGKATVIGTSMIGFNEEGSIIGMMAGSPTLIDSIWWPRGDSPNECELHDRTDRLVAAWTTCFLMTMSLANCKNVETVDDSPQFGEAPVAKWHRRQRIPEIKFKTLVIDGKPVTRRTSNGTGEDADRALHICRGHFAHYTADAPLFGKYTGTFWRPQHTRGNEKFGQMEKEYAVVGPTEGRA